MISGQPNRIRSEGKGPSLQCSQDQSPDDGEETNRKSDDKASGKRSFINSRLSRSSTARGSDTGLVTVGPTNVKG